MSSPAVTAPAPSRHVLAPAMALAGILLVALNLRTAITSLGALLDEVRVGLHLSGALAGIVTTLPALSFAAFGALTPWLTRRFTPARVLVGAMAALALGEVLRAVTHSAATFVALSALALAGIAVANVLLPVMVKTYFPGRAGLITGVYTMTLTAGTTAAAAASVPIAEAFGSWRAGLGVWAVIAVVAMLPWLRAGLRRTPPGTRSSGAALAKVHPGRKPLGWAMAVYFGTQSLSGYATMGWLAQIFRDADYSPTTAGLLLAGVTGVGVPIALLMPSLAQRMRNLRSLVIAMSAAMVASYAGLAFAPHGGAVAWVVLLAIGQGAFPLALAMIGMRARTSEGTVALSAFAQSTGYLIAALGPFLVGLLYAATSGWVVPIGFLIVAALVQGFAGVFAAKPRFIED
ncbi:MAG: MFS transporter [Hamadaea sp.]|uniref:MFS transporter n=1 Tax=Hamadaea sp. TaxID=2024425 RepID=UPI0017CFD071|nr:MFS transporter [Hamadaea sp.]NUR69819.1 MFS transporter [Hamadaea sp.]NUT19201.1 MFS transporter [Hamadaea sp.]